MKTTLDGFIKLTRFKEYVLFVIVTTLIGAASARGTFSWELLGVLVANWLSVGFAFMINDVEDAADDALNLAKINRNPVSAGVLSTQTANIASYAVAAVAALVFALLGAWPFVIGVVSLIVGWLYSWKPVRLKAMPLIDVLSHCMMLAGFQFLAAYFTFTHHFGDDWAFPFLSLVAISAYGELFNELRDLEGDLKAGVTHTAAVIGARTSHWLMNSLLVLGIGSAFVTFFVVQLVPVWVLVLLVALAAVFLLRPALRLRRHQSLMEMQAPLQVPVQIAGAIAMSAWFVAPWLDRLLKIGLFQ